MRKLSRALLFLAAALSQVNLGQAQSNYELYRFTTFAGSPGNRGSIDGPLADARFDFPSGVALDGAGNLYVADERPHLIRKIAPAGIVSTLAGTPHAQGSADGVGSAARFFNPYGITVGPDNNIYVTETNNHTIRRITPGGVVTTVAGLALNPGSADGTGSAARFSFPRGIAADNAGNLYVADGQNRTIRKITPAGVVTTFAGSAGNAGSADGNGSAAQFQSPTGIAVDNAGNIYVGDGPTIRKITLTADVTTLAGLAGSPGSADGIGSAARFTTAAGLAVDVEGNVYVGDTGSRTVRKVTPAAVVTTLAGLAGSGGYFDGTGSAVRFDAPTGLAVDSAGRLFLAESGPQSSTIRLGVPVSQLLNISTRVRVQTGNNTLIGGFIVTGTHPKTVMIRAIGPSLANSGVQGFLPDPTLELYASSGAFIVSNDDWKNAFNASAMQATGIAPSHDFESAILATLSQNQGYTAVVRGKGSATGLGLVEVYDLDKGSGSVLANISSRGLVETADNVMIGGFILGGSDGASRVIVRGLGPSLSQSAIGNPLPDPTLELYNGNGILIASNDNWADTQQAEVEETGIPPGNGLESAIVRTLPAGPYTAILADKERRNGIALVEVYDLD